MSRAALVLVVLILAAGGVGAVFWAERDGAGVRVDMTLSDPLAVAEFPHNQVRFVDPEGREWGRLAEVNGWLLLEALLRRTVDGTVPSTVATLVPDFEVTGGLFGWWTRPRMASGRAYFVGKPPVRLFPDADDTAWAHHLLSRQIDAEKTLAFLSDLPLPPVFAHACAAVGCRHDRVVRVWGHPSWHDDLDIVVTASFLTALDLSSALNREVYGANVALLERLIATDTWSQATHYFEPRRLAAGLLLYYDSALRAFLSPAARASLRSTLAAEAPVPGRIQSKWGGGEDLFFGLQIHTSNGAIPALLLRALPPP